MGAGAKARVTAPPVLPPTFSLIRAARDALGRAQQGQDDRWENGITYLPQACTVGDPFDPCDITPSVDAPDVAATVEAEPMALWATDPCISVFEPYGDKAARARQLLAACESKQLAGEFWGGTLAQASGWDNPFLANNDANTVSNGALAEANALSCLEDALASCGCGRSMIHATPGVVTMWRSFHLVERVGNLLVTVNDTIVVPDAGYDGSGPDGQAAADGSVWAYGTGLVDVRLGNVQVVPDSVAGGVDRSVNNLEVRAQRLGLATFDPCCHVAVEIDAPRCAHPQGS